jgi:ATP-dependent Clp protease protease subunit
LYKFLAEKTGKDVKDIERDADRDKYFTAQEAKEYGLIDKVIKKRQ